MNNLQLIGIGLYTPREAGKLIGVRSAKIARWLRGHVVGNKEYKRLWRPQVDLSDGAIYLGFRDLMELRTASQFIDAGLSPQRVRRAIELAGTIIDDEHPLSTTKFKTDGKSIFLELADEENDPRLLDLFRGQYVLSKIVERSFKDVDFEGISPTKWWIGSRKNNIVVDPKRAFGQPIDEESGVPTAVLATAANAIGSAKQTARDWCVPVSTVQRAIKFEQSLEKVAA